MADAGILEAIWSWSKSARRARCRRDRRQSVHVEAAGSRGGPFVLRPKARRLGYSSEGALEIFGVMVGLVTKYG